MRGQVQLLRVIIGSSAVKPRPVSSSWENPIVDQAIGFFFGLWITLWTSCGQLRCCAAAVDKLWTSFFVILVDSLDHRSYNTSMMTKNTTRKKRVDRNHIIYELRVRGQSYIGVTAKTESTVNKSVLARAAKHYYRAKKEAKAWLLCAALRELEDKSEIEVLVHEVIRGKAAAHRREVEIRRTLRPALNTDVRGD